MIAFNSRLKNPEPTAKKEVLNLPVKNAAFKNMRQSERRRRRNVTCKSELKTLAKKTASLIAEENPDEAKRTARNLMSKYDRAAKKGVIRKGHAARKKSRLMRKLSLATKAAR